MYENESTFYVRAHYVSIDLEGKLSVVEMSRRKRILYENTRPREQLGRNFISICNMNAFFRRASGLPCSLVRNYIFYLFFQRSCLGKVREVTTFYFFFLEVFCYRKKNVHSVLGLISEVSETSFPISPQSDEENQIKNHFFFS